MLRALFVFAIVVIASSCNKERRVEYKIHCNLASEAHVIYYGRDGIREIKTANDGFGHTYYDEPGEPIYFWLNVPYPANKPVSLEVRIDGDVFYYVDYRGDQEVVHNYRSIIPEK